MNKPQSARKPRGRGSKRSKGGGSPGRGDNRVKGNPKQAQDKYKSLGRDALQAGDRILAEYYFQHADHYQRVINERYGVAADTEQGDRVEGQRPEREGDDDVAQVQPAEKDEKPKRRRPVVRRTPTSDVQEPAQGDLIASSESASDDGGEDEGKPVAKPRTRRRKETSPPAEADISESVAK